MADEDDENDAISSVLNGGLLPEKAAATRGGFLQVKHQTQADASLDDYIKESEDGLSSALGPRWNAKQLNENAEKSTEALLRGIGGGKTMSHLKGMLAGLR